MIKICPGIGLVTFLDRREIIIMRGSLIETLRLMKIDVLSVHMWDV